MIIFFLLHELGSELDSTKLTNNLINPDHNSELYDQQISIFKRIFLGLKKVDSTPTFPTASS